ncbi:MAG TPA: M20 family metallopeptidase [Propionibacteriaceae bacterium]|nr:M20 family metallopeptidase [Propionibacteriaceae bacterium]
MSQTSDYLASIADDLSALRRDLHRIPEIGLDLPLTQQRLLGALDGLPLEITLGESLSSITAVLRGKGGREGERKAVLLRGDMDGLPVDEATGLDFASTNGAMHACGHDLHMSLLVGAARALCEQVDNLPGDVVFMFQPGEEGNDGAGHMIAEGVLDASGRRVDAAFAIHVFSAMEPYGVFATRPGTMMAASDRLTVTITGKGGHGSAPYAALDPVPVMAEMIIALQVMVARHFNVFDPVVVTVGKAVAGTANNIIPETALFEATLRSFSKQAQAGLFEWIPRTLRGIADSHGVVVDIVLENQYPATVNDPGQEALAAEVVSDVFGAGRHVRWENPLTGAEDFSRVLEEVPGAFVGLSAVPVGADHLTAPYNHSAYAVFDDSVLADGAALLVELAKRTLNS